MSPTDRTRLASWGRCAGLSVCLFFATSLISEPPVQAEGVADSEVQQELAKSLYAEAVALSEQARWSDAADRFLRSLDLVPRARTAYNLSVALLRGGYPVRALEALARYDAVAANSPEAERAEAERLRVQCQLTVAHLTVRVTPAEAELVLDARAVKPRAAEYALELDPGRHVLQASLDERTTRLEVELTSGADALHSLVLSPLPVAPPLPKVTLPLGVRPMEGPVGTSVQPSERPRWRKWWLWGAAGVAVVGASTLTVWAVLREPAGASCGTANTCITSGE